MVDAGANALDAILFEMIDSGLDPSEGLSCSDLDSELESSEDGQVLRFISGCYEAQEGSPIDTVEFSVKVFDEGAEMDSGLSLKFRLGSFEA